MPNVGETDFAFAKLSADGSLVWRWQVMFSKANHRAKTYHRLFTRPFVLVSTFLYEVNPEHVHQVFMMCALPNTL